MRVGRVEKVDDRRFEGRWSGAGGVGECVCVSEAEGPGLNLRPAIEFTSKTKRLEGRREGM